MTSKCPISESLIALAPQLEYRSVNEVARQVVDEIAHFGDACLPVLKRMLGDDRHGIRHERLRLLVVGVVEGLAQDAGEPWIVGLLQHLVELLEADQSSISKSAVVVAIGAMGASAREAVPALESQFRSENGVYRLRVATALLKVDPDHQQKPEWLDALINGVCNGNSSIASSAAGCLTHLGSKAETVLPTLERLHTSKCRLTQCFSGAAIYGISGELQPYLDGLSSLLESTSVSNRMLAVIKLTCLGSRAVPVAGRLRQILAEFSPYDADDEQEQLRKSIEYALLEMVSDPPASDSAIPDHR